MGEDIDLRLYLSLVWRRRYTIGAVTLAAILAASVVTVFFLPPVYEARTLLLAADPGYRIGASPDPQGSGLQIGAVLASQLPVETMVVFARSNRIVPKVAGSVSAGVPQGSRLPETLAVKVLRNTNLVQLTVRGRDPERTARVANAWAAVVETESVALFSAEAYRVRAFFDTRLTGARQRLDAAERTVRTFAGTSQIGILQARVDALTRQIAEYRSRRTDLSVSMRRAETELAQIETELRRQQRVVALSKSITADPFLHQAASEVTHRGVVDLSKLTLKSEELNPVYVTLDRARSEAAVRVAALKAERDQVRQEITRLDGELAVVRDTLAGQQLRQTQLLRAQGNARQVYDVLQLRREEAAVAASTSAGSLRIVVEAAVPVEPVGPNVARTLALAALVGLIAGTMLAFAIEYVTLRTRPVETSMLGGPSLSHRSE